ncbi:MAG: NADH:ubiquinone reductase (Na(+)-transporting) subunit F [Verrucomicrobia bacterium]|nr:NADH:ubiquinone reductase (Na(+)-transporting) subunit F [Verrucomicrobiota bacterium]
MVEMVDIVAQAADAAAHGNALVTGLKAVLVLCGLGSGLAVLLVVSEYFFANYGECTINVNNGDRTYTVQGGQTLLSALAENKLFVPSACGGQGTCGYCKAKVLNDIGPILPTEEPQLTRLEKKQNVRLSCQIKVKADMRIEVPEEYFAIQEFRTEVLSNKQVTDDIVEIQFKLLEPQRMKFQAGKYVQLRIPRDAGIERMRGKFGKYDFTGFNAKKLDTEKVPKTRFVERAYSMSNSPGRNDIVELAVRIAPPPRDVPDGPPGFASSYIWSLKPGEEVWLTGPYGDFLIKDTDRPKIFVGGGAGMAPMKAMILELFEVRKTTCTVKFFYGARARKDIFYDDIFSKIAAENDNFEYVVALSEPAPDDNWNGPTGFVHLTVEKAMEQFGFGNEYYLCGPPLMVDACTAMLTKHGVPEKDIAFDKF